MILVVFASVLIECTTKSEDEVARTFSEDVSAVLAHVRYR